MNSDQLATHLGNSREIELTTTGRYVRAPEMPSVRRARSGKDLAAVGVLSCEGNRSDGGLTMRTGRLAALTLMAATTAAGAGIASAASMEGPLGTLGAASRTPQPVYAGYYDGHKDAYLITDVSNRAQAKALHINYAAALSSVKGAPAQYFIQGRAAPGQLAVFGSEPGESDYNPLWEEQFVTWKPGVKPVVLVSDNQINALAKKGKLTVKDAHIVLNAPITKVGK
jgi:hypothetical protein